MPFAFHENREIYFSHQTLTTQKYIIPFIEQCFPIEPNRHVLEIGCAEAGVLKAFLERGCLATGVDLAANKLDVARSMLPQEIADGRLTLINKNIYEEEFREHFKEQFDLIILKDVIEHIPEQQKLLGYLRTFLKAKGVIFFSFPPWQMPFGGHQQMCQSKFLSRLPYVHLLPSPLYKLVLETCGESIEKINGLADIKKTGLSIERFERILSYTHYEFLSKRFFLINPIYEYKFKLKPREQKKWLASIPVIRNFVTTAVYYLVQKD